MKYVITFIWALIISQVTFYLGAQLTKMSYNPIHALLLAIVSTICVSVLLAMLPPINKAMDHSKH